MKYTWTSPITELGILLSALYTGSRGSKKYDADILVDADEILVRQYLPGKQIICSKIDAYLFEEAQLNGFTRRKIIENDPMNQRVFTLTRNTERMEHVHRILALQTQAEHT